MYVLKYILYIYTSLYIYIYIHIDITHVKGINKPSFQRRSERPSSKPSVALHTQLASFHAPAVQMGQRGRIHFSKKKTAALFTWFPNWHIFCLCNVLDYNFSGPARKTSLLMINFNRAPLVVADWAMPRFRKRSVFLAHT